MTDLLQLAEDLEQAKDFEWKLCERVFAALRGREYPLFGYTETEFRELIRESGNFDSVDVLLNYVPEGWTVGGIRQDDSKRWWVELRKGYQTSFSKVIIAPSWPQGHTPPLRGCYTPALALGAAILRAMHHGD